MAKDSRAMDRKSLEAMIASCDVGTFNVKVETDISEAVAKALRESPIPGPTATVPTSWSLSTSDPVKDMQDFLDKSRPWHERHYSAQETSKYPDLKFCSRCNTERTIVRDPWGTVKKCPICGHVDPVGAYYKAPVTMKSVMHPGSLALPEVQRLLAGLLRQMEDNKASIDEADFDITGLVFYQTTSKDTGIVTIWFEKE